MRKNDVSHTAFCLGVPGIHPISFVAKLRVLLNRYEIVGSMELSHGRLGEVAGQTFQRLGVLTSASPAVDEPWYMGGTQFFS